MTSTSIASQQYIDARFEISVKALWLMLLALSACCLGAHGQSTNSKPYGLGDVNIPDLEHAPSLEQLLAELPPGSVQSVRPVRTNASEFAFTAAVKEHLGSRLQTVHVEEVIAWAVKCAADRIPPMVSEEAIVKIEWSDHTNRNHVLIAVMRSEGGRFAQNPPWRIQANRVTAGWEEFDSIPSSEQLAHFIRETNFGTNECMDFVQVLKTIFYTEDPQILNALESPLPEAEKRRRASLKLFFHRPSE